MSFVLSDADQPPKRMPFNPKYLEGKLGVIEEVECCDKYHPRKGKGGGSSEFGSLMVTKYRLTFTPTIAPSEPLDLEIYQKEILGSRDILLSNISHFVLNNGKKTRVISKLEEVRSAYMDMEVVCQDFNTHSFHFLKGAVQDDKVASSIVNFLNAMIKISFPSKRRDLLAWCPAARGCGRFSDDRLMAVKNMYTDFANTQEGSMGRVFQAKDEFMKDTTLPSYFLLPEMHDPELYIQNYAIAFDGQRPPVLCCNTSKGAALLRCGDQAKDKKAEFHKAIGFMEQSTSISKPVEVKLNKRLVSLDEVFESRRRLRELCQPASREDFTFVEKHWFGEISRTNWLGLVSDALRLTAEIVSLMVDVSKSVLLVEKGGSDWSCVIASLVQLCLFRRFRTQKGFERVIDREWIMMGHDFPARQTHYRPKDIEHGPLFPLFIDCVYQLTQQYPMEFEFSEDYLTFLHDASYMPIFYEFSFSTERERAYTSANLTHLLSVWRWVDHLTETALDLLSNPLYILGRQFLNYRPQKCLRPIFSPHILEFWSHIYFRWLQFVHIPNGGSAANTWRNREFYNDLVNLAADCATPQKDQLHSASESSPDGPVTKETRKDGTFRFPRGMKRQSLVSAFPFSTLERNQDMSKLYDHVDDTEVNVMSIPHSDQYPDL